MAIMDKDTKEIVQFYSIWSLLIGLVVLLIKPFICIKQMARDMAITFVVSFCCGMILEYFEMPLPVKCGLSGVMGIFGVSIYNIIYNLLTQVEKDPVSFIKDTHDKYK